MHQRKVRSVCVCVTCVAVRMLVVIVVKHSERWHYHGPNSRFYLGLSVRVAPPHIDFLLLIGVQKVSLGKRAAVRVRCRRAIHRVTAALVTIILRHTKKNKQIKK